MSEVMENSVQIPDAELKEKIVASDRSIRRAWTSVTKMSMVIGWEGAFIERNNGWETLGFKHQHEYRIAVGIGRSNWYRVLGIADRFQKLDKEIFLSMLMENADRLSRQPEEVRYDPKIIEAAATMSMREFADTLVTQEEHRNGKPIDEEWVDVVWRMKAEQRAVIEKGIQEWRQEHGIDNDAYALELMISEFRERPTLVGFILESIHKLTATARDTKEYDELRERLVDHIKEMGEILTTCVGEGDDES